MNRTSVIVSLLIAVGLTVISMFTLRPSDSAAAERQSVLELDPSGVMALSVVREPAGAGEARAIRVERGRLPGQWLVRSGEGSWPVAAERMRAALRVLAELRGARVDEPLPEGAATLTIEREGADPLSIRIAPPGLGGRRLVEVSAGEAAAGVVFEIDDWLHEAMVTSGPLQWRDRSAMPGVSVEASRITLVSGSMRMTLSRAGGRWGLTAPVSARASPEAVEALLGLLARTQVSRFYDDPPADDITGLDEPLAQVRIERDVQIPDGAAMQRITESVSLTVGGPIDATMTALFARAAISSSLAGAPRGTAVVAVSAEDLNRINPIPNAYIAAQAVGQPSSEIGGLAVARPGSEAAVALERTRSGWELKRAGPETGSATGAAVSDARARAIADILHTFCEAPAGAILIELPQNYQPTVTVVLQSLGGSPLEMIELGAVPAPAEAGVERFLVIRTGGVYRVYESRALAGLELLEALLGEVAPGPAGERQQRDEPGDAEPEADG